MIIKNQKVLFIIGVYLGLLYLILILNINLLAVSNLFLYNIFKFIFSKLLLFICVLPVVFLSSWGIISGFFGIERNLLSIRTPGHSDLISGLNDTLYTINNQVWTNQIQTRGGYQNNIHTNLTGQTNHLSDILNKFSNNSNVSEIIQQVRRVNPNWQAPHPSNLQQHLASEFGCGYSSRFGGGPSSIIDDVSGDTLGQIIQLLTNVLYLNSITISLLILLLFVFSARLYIIRNSNALDVVKIWPLGKYLYWFVNRFINAWGKGSIIWIYSIIFLTIYFNCVIGYALWHILAILN